MQWRRVLPIIVMFLLVVLSSQMYIVAPKDDTSAISIKNSRSETEKSTPLEKRFFDGRKPSSRPSHKNETAVSKVFSASTLSDAVVLVPSADVSIMMQLLKVEQCTDQGIASRFPDDPFFHEFIQLKRSEGESESMKNSTFLLRDCWLHLWKHATAVRENSAGHLGNGSIPLLCSLATAVDFPLQLQMLLSTDVPLMSLFIFINHDSRVSRSYWGAVGELLSSTAPRFLVVELQRRNVGVSRAWNQCLRHAFLPQSFPNGRIVPWVAISNADFHHKPHHLHSFVLETAMNANDYWLHMYYGFAYFAVSFTGFHTLGYFDENFFPAYGEDQEMIVRCIAAGGGKGNAKCHSFPVPPTAFVHASSVNLKKDPAVRNIHLLFDGDHYLLLKWGVHRPSTTIQDYRLLDDYHRHPFNLSAIPFRHSWVVDGDARRCILLPKEKNHHRCRFNVSLVRSLLRKVGDPKWLNV